MGVSSVLNKAQSVCMFVRLSAAKEFPGIKALFEASFSNKYTKAQINMYSNNLTIVTSLQNPNLQPWAPKWPNGFVNVSTNRSLGTLISFRKISFLIQTRKVDD